MRARRLFGLALVSVTTATVCGMPAQPGLRNITQPDGTVIKAELVGDEHFHYYVTPDGLPLVDNSNGVLEYAGYDMLPTGIKAHNPGERTARELEYVGTVDREAFMDGIMAQRAKSPALSGRRNVRFPSQGPVKGLVILAEFADNTFVSPTAQSDFSRMMNEPGYSDFGATGSARDYFLAQSDGKFQPTFDVYGPVKLPHDMKFYGENVSGRASDKDVPQMIVDACKGASTEIDFSQYDFDDNGEVDLVFVIYAGYNEAQGGGGSTIWPHAWDIKEGGKNLRLNGTTIGRYACTSELNGNEGTTPDGIGTFCHEFTHCLGLPDIYDVNYSGFVGMGAWDLMDAGGYNNSSRTPAAFSAYEREFCGWLEMTVLDEPRANVSLGNLPDTGQAYKIVSPYNPDEYYTLENRQLTGWDSFLPGHGLLITHIDYDAQIWKSNLVNTVQGGHPHIQIVPSHGNLSQLEDAAFPGLIDNDVFSSFSTPSSTLYTGGTLDAPVSDIKEQDGVIIFGFRTWLDAPLALDAEDITENGCLARWQPVEGAECYDVEINALETGSLIHRAVETEMNLPAGGEFLSPLYALDRHHTFTAQLGLKGTKTTMNGVTLELVDQKGKTVASKRITVRDYDRDEYWVFQSSVAGRLRLSATVDVDVSMLELYNGNVESDLRAGRVPEVSGYTFSKAVSHAQGASVLVEGLDPGREYIYSVRAVNESNGSASAPSNKICFTTHGEPSAVETLPAGAMALTPVPGAIELRLSDDCDVCVAALSGAVVYNGRLAAGTHRMELASGLYIVKVDGLIGKCIVR